MMKPSDRVKATLFLPVLSARAERGLRVRLARIAIGKTQAELGGFMGLTHDSISRIELGARDVSAFELVKISTFLDQPMAYFNARQCW